MFIKPEPKAVKPLADVIGMEAALAKLATPKPAPKRVKVRKTITNNWTKEV